MIAWPRPRRDELVVRACHELRGALTAAGLALHAGATAGVEAELRRAALALDDLAAARRGGRAADRHDRIDVGELLDRQAATWRAAATAWGSELDLVAPAEAAIVRGDALRLTQAVGNLVANALEHGTGRVVLRGRREGDRVRIEVADEGPGLPGPVRRLARRPRAERGRGLAIASDIVARHGGRLVARGARVAIELPACP